MTRNTLRAGVAIAALAGLATAALAADATVIAIEGQTLTGSDGMVVNSFGSPFTNGLGQVGFTGALANPEGGTVNFVFFNDQVVFLSNSVPGDTITGAESTMGVSDTGGWIYSPSYNGGDAALSSYGLLARDDDPAPGIPGQFLTFNSRPTMGADGTAYWVAGLTASQGGSSQGRAMYSYNPNTDTYTPLMQTGDSFGGITLSSTGVDFDYNFADNGNYIQVIDGDGATSSDGGVVVNYNLVAREGEATGQGDNWQNFDNVAINNSGNWLLSGDTDGATSSDEFIAYNGAIGLREGATVDGVTLGSAVNALSLNNLNQAAFIWSSSLTETLFFASDASNLSAAIQLLSVGDLVEHEGDLYTIDDFNASGTIGPGLDFSDNPWVFVEVDLEDASGASFEAIIRVAVPAPGAASVLAMAGLAATRRRRR